jgi:hypothetical protein
VPQPCTVLIAPSEHLAALRKRAASPDVELLAFTDADALLALDAIVERRPAIIALERLFAATPRGAALINRIKADPSLLQSEIRVVSHDSDYSRVSPRKATDIPAPPAPAIAGVTVAPPPPLDYRGTRRAPRFKIAGKVDVLVDGNNASLVDLSTLGAQVISPTVLKPNQRIRMTLPDDSGIIRFNAQVAWASFEIPATSSPRYRAGIDFVDADAGAVSAFCARHKVP